MFAQCELAEFIWADGNHGGCDGVDVSIRRSAAVPRPDWAADRKHADLHFGWAVCAGAGGGAGRVVYRWGGGGAGIFESAGIDGGAICGRSIRAGSGRTDVSDGGPGAVAAGW